MIKNIGEKPKDASVIIPHYNKKILLQLRSNNKKIFYPLKWGCIGGAKEKGERSVTTALREFFEETNINIDSKDLIFFSKLEFFVKPQNKVIKRFFYTLKIKNLSNFMKNLKVNEGRKLKFFNEITFNKLSKVVPYDKFMLDYFFHKNKH
tara:strand:- start:3 stop:452 length:450 start_codon:yes stop_codon:yes gene_type:complete